MASEKVVLAGVACVVQLAAAFTTHYPNDCVGSGKFQCSNGLCIPWAWVCDGWNDCAAVDGYDEADCYFSSTDTSVTTESARTTDAPPAPTTYIPRTTTYPTYPTDSSPSPITTTASPPIPCPAPFGRVGDRCLFVDVLEMTWNDARYMCKSIAAAADLVVIDSPTFFVELLDFINYNGLTSHDYWVGANDTTVEGQWEWLDGTPVRMGTPYWAIYGTSSFEQEPRKNYGDNYDCAHMSKSRYFYLNHEQCDTAMGSICQMPLGSTVTAPDMDSPTPNLP